MHVTLIPSFCQGYGGFMELQKKQAACRQIGMKKPADLIDHNSAGF